MNRNTLLLILAAVLIVLGVYYVYVTRVPPSQTSGAPTSQGGNTPPQTGGSPQGTKQP